MTTSGATPTVSWFRTRSSLEFGGTTSYDPWNLKLLTWDLSFFQVAVWKIRQSMIMIENTHTCIYIYICIHICVCVSCFGTAFSQGATCLLWSSSRLRSGGSADAHDFRISVDTDLPGMIDRPSNVDLLVDQSCHGCRRNLISWGDEVSSCHLASLWKV